MKRDSKLSCLRGSKEFQHFAKAAVHRCSRRPFLLLHTLRRLQELLKLLCLLPGKWQGSVMSKDVVRAFLFSKQPYNVKKGPRRSPQTLGLLEFLGVPWLLMVHASMRGFLQGCFCLLSHVTALAGKKAKRFLFLISFAM